MIQSLTASASAPFTVREACAALGVSESGFYARQPKAQRPRRRQDSVIIREMKEVFEQSYRCYGSPRLVRGFWCAACGNTACAAARLAFVA